MVCIRCKIIVRQVLTNLGYHYLIVEMGSAEIVENITLIQKDELKAALLKFGLELMDDKKSILIEKIKGVIVELIHYSDEPLKTNFSNYLSAKLAHDYTYLANLFSEAESMTMEHFIINQKIERVKELLVYDELSLTEISYQLHYSSVAHLSNQFKRTTGFTPSHFKKLKNQRKVGI